MNTKRKKIFYVWGPLVFLIVITLIFFLFGEVIFLTLAETGIPPLISEVVLKLGMGGIGIAASLLTIKGCYFMD